MDTPRTSISDAEHYKLSARIRLHCADLILATFEKLRGHPIGQGDRVLDLGCGLREMLDPLWVNKSRNPGYVLGLDVDFGGAISRDIKQAGSQWKQFAQWETENPREFVQANALEWNLPKEEMNQFSIIYSGSALHWIVAGEETGSPANGKVLFTKISDALRPGGWFVAHTPGCENFYPLFTRIIIAALNDIKSFLSGHEITEVKDLGSLKDIREWLKIVNKEDNVSKIEDEDGFDAYWRFRREARIAFWEDYKAIRKDFKEAELQERLLLRGLDWELVSTDEFYSHWASAGKSVFWERFQTTDEGDNGGNQCALYDKFEHAFKAILEDDEKLKTLKVSPMSINGKRYIRHYCHRYYIILQKPGPNGARQRMGGTSLIGLPIGIVHDVAMNDAPLFAKSDEKDEFSGVESGWQQPFRTLKGCLPEGSMKYGMFLRKGRNGEAGTRKEIIKDRKALLQKKDSVEAKWQYKIDGLLESGVKVAQFTSMGKIAENARPVSLVVGGKESIPDRLLEMADFTHSQSPWLEGKATPVFIVASTTNPRADDEEPPDDSGQYGELLVGATSKEIEEQVSFMFYSSESVYEELRRIENEDVGALSFLRALRWHGSVAFPCAFVLGHTAPTMKAGEPEPDVHFASASVLLALGGPDHHISFADMALIGGSLRIMSLWDQVAAERDLRLRVAEASKQSARAAIMSRNMSHNIGSHVLSQINDKAMANTDDMKILHAYLQRRMDLVARITSRLPDWGEPLWFFGDLLRGFLSQNILLNHLVKDQGGWCENKIAFCAIVDSGGEKKIEYKAYKAKDADKKNGKDGHAAGWLKSLDDALSAGLEDFLVSIPDGTIGAQAFYVLLESLMRNSAKYGKVDPKPDAFEIHLDISNRTEYYEIAIWDNLSTCPPLEKEGAGQDKFKLCADMQGKIREKLLDARSLGVAEMREACGFLIHPYGDDYPVYPLKDNGGAERVCEHCSSKGAEHPNASGQQNEGSFPLWVECHKPNGAEYLRYRLHLAKPRMVGIAGLGDVTLISEAKKLGISRLADKNEFLGRKGAFQFGVILLNGNEEANEVCSWISNNHTYLPQRLLLVSANGVDGKCLLVPDRRAVWCTANEIGLDSVNKDSGADINGADGRGDAEQFIRRVYQTWILKRWPESSNGVTLNITLDRAKLAWASNGEGTQGLITIYVYHTHTNTENIKARHIDDIQYALDSGNAGSGLKNDQTGHVVIDYSNHDDWDQGNKTKILVVFKNGDKTFETLSVPPQTQFAKDCLFLGLIEAALAKVVILDERVALWACREGEDAVRVEACQKACTWPVFKISDSAKDYYLTDYLEACVKITIVGNECLPAWVIEEAGTPMEVYGYAERDRGTPARVSGIDIVVAHIGVAETVGMTAVQGTTEGFLKTGYGIAPAVIMTSGRGGAADKRSGCDLPFMEYSVLKEYFVNDVAKYHLVRTLMSTKASKED